MNEKHILYKCYKNGCVDWSRINKKQLTHKKRLTKNKKDGIITSNIRGSAIFASQNKLNF